MILPGGNSQEKQLEKFLKKVNDENIKYHHLTKDNNMKMTS